MHILYEKPSSKGYRRSRRSYAEEQYRKMIVTGPEHACSIAEVRSQGERNRRLCITQTRLPQSTWTVRTSCVVWERSCGVKIEAFRDPGPSNLSGKWTGFNIDVCGSLRTIILLELTLGHLDNQ